MQISLPQYFRIDFKFTRVDFDDRHIYSVFIASMKHFSIMASQTTVHVLWSESQLTNPYCNIFHFLKKK